MHTASAASTSSAVSAKPSTRASRASSRRRRARAVSPGGRSIGSTASGPTDGGDIDMTVPHSPALSQASSFDHEGLSRAPIPSSRERGRHSRYPSNTSDSAMLSPPLFPVGQVKSPSTTPKGPSDADAAELMLFLATSPSPARPSVSSRPPGAAAKAARVLFPTSSSGEEAEGGSMSSVAGPPINTSSVTRNPEKGMSPTKAAQEEISAGALLPPPSPIHLSGSQETRVDSGEDDTVGGSQSTLFDGKRAGETEKSHSGLASPLNTPYRGTHSSYPYGMETPRGIPSSQLTPNAVASNNGDYNAPYLYPDPIIPQGGAVNFSEYFSVSPAPSTWTTTPNAHAFPRSSGQSGAGAAVGRRLFQDEEETSETSSQAQGAPGQISPQMQMPFSTHPTNKGGTGTSDGQHSGTDLVGVGATF